MRKNWFVAAAVAIALLFYTLGAATASNPIKIFVDGKEVKSDVPAQLVSGRTMVPLRVVGEALGADVKWDGAQNAVIITSTSGGQTAPVPSTPATTSKGLSKSNPVPMGEPGATPDGFTVKVTSVVEGDRAWDIVRTANMFNDAPADGYKYVIVRLAITNNKSAQDPEQISGIDFALVGSSNIVFKTHQRIVALSNDGDFKGLRGQLYHGGTLTGALCFHVPTSETNLVLTWDKPWDAKQKRYYEVK